MTPAFVAKLDSDDEKLTRHQSPRSSQHPVPAQSFLRWAGGKQLLLKRLLPFLPASVDDLVYHEPFLGAGTLLFAVQPQSAHVSDLNAHLINCYEQVRRNPTGVARSVRRLAASDSAEHYYSVRETYNRCSHSVEQAARFIYLNRTCFNGIFRVNTRGEFNVPYGHKDSPRYPDFDALRNVASVLERVKLRVEDFRLALARCGVGDFVYLDPPYPPLNGTSYFTHYTLDRFGESDQYDLASAVACARTRGAHVMMSNADTPLIRDLYQDFTLNEISVTRYVTCKRVKHQVGELVITTY